MAPSPSPPYTNPLHTPSSCPRPPSRWALSDARILRALFRHAALTLEIWVVRNGHQFPLPFLVVSLPFSSATTLIVLNSGSTRSLAPQTDGLSVTITAATVLCSTGTPSQHTSLSVLHEPGVLIRSSFFKRAWYATVDRGICLHDSRYGGIAAPNGGVYTSTLGAPDVGQWTHVVATFETGADCKVYRNDKRYHWPSAALSFGCIPLSL